MHGQDESNENPTTKRYSIGEMAELNCTSKRALRIYQEEGLLEPSEVDEETGYRYYSLDQCATIDMIQHMQTIGFTLREMRELRGNRSIEQLAGSLSKKLDVISDELAQVQSRYRIAEDMLNRCNICLNMPIENQIMLEHLPERRIVIFENPDPDSLDLPDGMETLRMWEVNLRYIKREMVQLGIPLAYFRNVCCMVRRENLESDKLVFTHSFIFVDDALKLQNVTFDVMPAGQYLTMYSSKTLAPDGRTGELYELRRILEYAEHKGFEIDGHYYGESIADTPAFLFEGRECLLKLNVPVRRRNAGDHQTEPRRS